MQETEFQLVMKALKDIDYLVQRCLSLSTCPKLQHHVPISAHHVQFPRAYCLLEHVNQEDRASRQFCHYPILFIVD